jgi:hypothetical protein
VCGDTPPPSRALRVSSGNDLRPPLTAEPLYRLRSDAKGQAGACPDRTRVIPCKVRALTAEGSMIRNMRGMISADRKRAIECKQAECTNSLDRTARLRSRDRARHVPDRVVRRELSRPLPGNTASVATWPDTGKLSRAGDLTRKRSLVQIQYGPRHFSKSCLALEARMGATLQRLCPISAGRSLGIPASA